MQLRHRRKMFAYEAKELRSNTGGDGPRERRVEPDYIPLPLALLFFLLISLLIIVFVILITVIVAAGSKLVVKVLSCISENLLI